MILSMCLINEILKEKIDSIYLQNTQVYLIKYIIYRLFGARRVSFLQVHELTSFWLHNNMMLFIETLFHFQLVELSSVLHHVSLMWLFIIKLNLMLSFKSIRVAKSISLFELHRGLPAGPELSVWAAAMRD